VVNTQQSLAQVLAEPFRGAAPSNGIAQALRGLRRSEAAQNVLDYDDLLLGWSTMLEDAALAAEVGGRFSHILVDEYQDTNRLQAAIVKALRPTATVSPSSATTHRPSSRSARLRAEHPGLPTTV